MRILGVCGGNGVMLYAMRKHLIGNIENRAIFHTKGQEQWKANFGDTQMCRTIAEFNGPVPERIDWIIGHPDCGHSSILSYSRKKSLGNPKENASMDLYLASLKTFRPKGFVMENLPKLKDTLGDFEEVFPDYDLKVIEGPVTMFGNSQVNRVRLLIVGVRKDLKSKKVLNCFKVLPEETYPIKTTGELFKDLLPWDEPKIGNVREPDDTIITMYTGFKLSASEIHSEWNNERAGESRWRVVDRNFTTAPGVYRNLEQKPPNTVRKGNREFNPDGYMMSPRERAIIQGLPDTFHIYIDENKLGYWINKGRATVTKCPPYEISKWLSRQIKRVERRGLFQTKTSKKSRRRKRS